MNNSLEAPGNFSCSMDLPIVVGGERRCVPVVAVFRGVALASGNEWVMPGGRPRSDRELATEVLLAIVSRGRDRTLPQNLQISKVLELDRAAALVVAKFLSTLSSQSEEQTASGGQRRVRAKRRKFKTGQFGLALRAWS